jgi:hypothetical protein
MVDTKPVWSRRMVAEFNTSQDTLSQIAAHEWNVDELFRHIYMDGLNTNDVSAIKSLYYLIVKIYADRIYSVMWSDLQTEANEKEKKLERLFNDWIKNNRDKIPTLLVEELRLYKRWLYEMKQKKLNMGIPAREEKTALEKLKAAAGVD